jgi:hypothetical protein
MFDFKFIKNISEKKENSIIFLKKIIFYLTNNDIIFNYLLYHFRCLNKLKMRRFGKMINFTRMENLKRKDYK